MVIVLVFLVLVDVFIVLVVNLCMIWWIVEIYVGWLGILGNWWLM